MLRYYFAVSINNIRSQKGLSTLIVGTLSLGIAACMITYSLIYLMSKDPFPYKSNQVFHIQLDNWPRDEFALAPNLPPEEVTWRDALNIVQAKQAKFQAANALTWGMVTPEDKDVPPFLGIIRATHGEFFSMFDVPFLFGEGWNNYLPNEVEYVTVLSKSTNDQVFKGQNSVGKILPMLGKLFTVIGVLDDWQPTPKYFDMSMGAFSEPDGLYVPLSIKAELELPHGGSSNCWETDSVSDYKAFLNSECVNFNLWIEFNDEHQREQFNYFLQTYVEQQKALGRFPKKQQNFLLDMNEWLDYKQVVDSDIYLFFYLAVLFLLVCLFNAASLISSKFSTKSAEMALRRALGASQQNILLQNLTEALLLGLLGALVGSVLSLLGLEAIKQLYPNFEAMIQLDLTLISMTVILSILASLIAGFIPSIRVCLLVPSAYLK